MMKIVLPKTTIYQAIQASDKLSQDELEEFNSLMTSLFNDKILKSAASSRLDFLAKKLVQAPFFLRATATPHQFELILQSEGVVQSKLEQTALHELVKTSSAAEVEALVAQHPEWIHTRNSRGQIPLAIAIESQTKELSRFEVVKVLTMAGSDVNLGDKDNWTPLYRASRGERLDILDHIAPLGAKEDVNQANLDARSTPLMRMVDSGSVAGVRILLGMGANPNAVNDLGSCVYYAAKNGSPELIALLYEQAHADLNRVDDPLGLTPLGVAINNNHQAAAEYLKAKGAALAPEEKDYTSLHALVAAGDAKAILESYKRHEKDKFGRSAVHYCAALGKIDLLQRMDPKRLDEPDTIYKRTPLHYAVIHGREDVVGWLASEAHCNVYSEDKAKHFPLTWAAQFGHESLARLLLKIAASRGEQLKMLQQVDAYGWTALLKAAKHNQVALVRLFVNDYSVDPFQQKTARGIGVLELAKEGNAYAVLAELQQNSISSTFRGKSFLRSNRISRSLCGERWKKSTMLSWFPCSCI